MQRHHESRTEDVLLMWKEDDPYQDGDQEDSAVVLEGEVIQSRHLQNQYLVPDPAAFLVASEEASLAVVVVVSEADLVVTGVIEVGMGEEEVLATIEEVIGVVSAVAHLPMLLVAPAEEVDLAGTMIDEMATEEVGMGADVIEEVQAATETL